jgi:hypothetical protein
MAGSPLKRARRQGVRLPDGSIIAFPYMPRVADLPSGWRHFSPAKKIEHLIGLDRCHEILSWPLDGLDPLRLSLKMQVIRIVLRICMKAMLEGKLGRERAPLRAPDPALEKLSLGLRARLRSARRPRHRPRKGEGPGVGGGG